MFCRNCGAELKNDDQFCSKCGFRAGDHPSAPVSTAPKKKLNPIQITILVMSAILVLVIVLCVITMVKTGLFSGQELSAETEVLETLPLETAPQNPVPEGNPYRQCYTAAEYILAESNTRYYAPAELTALSAEALMVAQTEITARHGQTVTDPALREYFDSLSWYKPGTIPKLNAYEEENLFLIDVCLRLRDGSLYRSSNPYMGYLSTAYVLPNSDTRCITGNELRRMSAQELLLARNEIYARHGYIFQDSTLKEYFCCKDWYQPATLAKDFSDIVFSEAELINLDMIDLYEDISGGTYLSPNNPYAHVKYYCAPGEYLFPDSSSYLLSEQSVCWMNPKELIIARNEIFARNGYSFTDDDLMEYFLSCSWYVPQVPPGRLDLVSLNSIERQNVNFLLDYQNYLEGAQGGSSSENNWSSS